MSGSRLIKQKEKGGGLSCLHTALEGSGFDPKIATITGHVAYAAWAC